MAPTTTITAPTASAAIVRVRRVRSPAGVSVLRLLLRPSRLLLGALPLGRLGTLPLGRLGTLAFRGLSAPPLLLLALSLGVCLGLSLRSFGALAFSLGPLLLGRALDVGDQLLDAVVERVVGDPQSVECGNLPDALVWPDGTLGQFLRARHLGVLHQRDEDPDLTVDRGFDLPPMPVLGVVDAPVALVVGRLQPAAADQQHEHIAGAQRCVDRLLPRPPGLDVVDVPEDGLGPEVEGEAIVDAPSEALAVVSTVRDEDPERGGGLAHRTATAFSLAQWGLLTPSTSWSNRPEVVVSRMPPSMPAGRRRQRYERPRPAARDPATVSGHHPHA